MPLFGKRRAAQAAEKQQQAASLKALEAAQSAFTANFRIWLDGIMLAQAETGANALTEDIVGRVGTLPLVGNALLTDTQQYFLRSYARSFGRSTVERRRISAVVAAAEAEKSRDVNAERLRSAVDYWESVEVYVARVLG